MAEKVNLKAAEAKAEEKTVTPEAKTVTPVKEEAPKAKTVRKKAVSKTTAEKKPARKSVKKAVKKTPTRTQAPKKSEVVKFEFNNKSYTPDELLKSARDVWQYDIGKKVSELKSIELYVKPEEERAYYVFNNDTTGSFII